MLFFSETVSLQFETECFILTPILGEDVDMEETSHSVDVTEDTEQCDVRIF